MLSSKSSAMLGLIVVLK